MKQFELTKDDIKQMKSIDEKNIIKSKLSKK